MKIGSGLLRTVRQVSSRTGFKPKHMIAGMGLLGGSTLMWASCAPGITKPDGDIPFLSQSEWQPLALKEKLTLTHNTKLLRFVLPSAVHTTGCSVASCLSIGFKDEDGKINGRPYTPVTKGDAMGTVDFIIKEYPAPDGKVSRHMCGLQPGDSVLFKGPWQKFKYSPNSYRSIGMVAGGTGITPMLQVAREILENPNDNTEVSLIFANVSENDIMLRDTLDALQFRYPRFKVHYVVDKAKSSDWNGGVGYVNIDMVKRYLPSPSTKSFILVCGPSGMVKHISGPKEKVGKKWTQGKVGGLFEKIGYSQDEVFKF